MGTERRNPWETRHWHKQKPQTQLVLGSARAAAQRGFTRAGATAPPELETQRPPMPDSTRQRLQGTGKGSNPRAGAHMLDVIPTGASLPPVGAFPHPAPLSRADFWELLAGLEEQQGRAGCSAAPCRVGSAAEMPLCTEDS